MQIMWFNDTYFARCYPQHNVAHFSIKVLHRGSFNAEHHSIADSKENQGVHSSYISARKVSEVETIVMTVIALAVL